MAKVVLTSEFVGCLSAAPSDLAQNHRRYLDESFDNLLPAFRTP